MLQVQVGALHYDQLGPVRLHDQNILQPRCAGVFDCLVVGDDAAVFVDQNRAARAVLSQALLNDAAAALGASVGVAIVGDQVGKNADFLCDRLHTPPPFIS